MSTDASLASPSSERRTAAEYVERLRVKVASIAAPVGTLSGGNQQKVVLAKWLSTEPKVLIVDEPTRGIDVATKAEVHRLMPHFPIDIVWYIHICSSHIMPLPEDPGPL